jgi:DegV family protein with EDD domain
MIGFCTDSNSQLPPGLAARYRVEVVPLTVTVDGEDFLEGVDLDADRFYERFDAGTPEVATAAPGPGLFADAYARLAAAGADEILSVHVGSELSATLESARVGARSSSVPVRLVDTGSASFVVACCLWEAAEAVAAGAGVEVAAGVAERVAARTGNVFVVGALDLARRGGRLAAGTSAADGIPVLSLVNGRITPVGSAQTVAEAADAMAATVLRAGGRLRVGVGVADTGAVAVGEELEQRLTGAEAVVDLVRYRIGPSVGAHTGPGTAGAVFYPMLA